MAKVHIREVGPREGLQTLTKIIPTEDKIKLLQLLSKTGVPEIEITSLVRSDRVPQMQDADELISRYVHSPGIMYSALYLNQEGFLRGEKSGRLDNEGWLYVATSETFLKKNSNTSLKEIIDQIPSWLTLFDSAKKNLSGLMISTAFGCSYEGAVLPRRVLEVFKQVIDAINSQGKTINELSLADTMGWGTPKKVRETLQLVRSHYPSLKISLHLHDTRGSGLANAYAGLLEGITSFDASVGGIGGCPFAKGAAGNIATEDLVFMCEEMGFKTGISLEYYVETCKFLEKILGQPLPGKYYKGVN